MLKCGYPLPDHDRWATRLAKVTIGKEDRLVPICDEHGKRPRVLHTDGKTYPVTGFEKLP